MAQSAASAASTRISNSRPRQTATAPRITTRARKMFPPTVVSQTLTFPPSTGIEPGAASSTEITCPAILRTSRSLIGAHVPHQPLPARLHQLEAVPLRQTGAAGLVVPAHAHHRRSAGARALLDAQRDQRREGHLAAQPGELDARRRVVGELGLVALCVSAQEGR